MNFHVRMDQYREALDAVDSALGLTEEEQQAIARLGPHPARLKGQIHHAARTSNCRLVLLEALDAVRDEIREETGSKADDYLRNAEQIIRAKEDYAAIVKAEALLRLEQTGIPFRLYHLTGWEGQWNPVLPQIEDSAGPAREDGTGMAPGMG